MTQYQPMTLDEKLDLCMKAIEAEKQGNQKEAERIMREEHPLPPYLAKWAKKRMGADFLIKNRLNLDEANAEFGSDWLNT